MANLRYSFKSRYYLWSSNRISLQIALVTLWSFFLTLYLLLLRACAELLYICPYSIEYLNLYTIMTLCLFIVAMYSSEYVHQQMFSPLSYS